MGDRIGQRLGNYRLISLLGQGGFAEVYLGEHVYLKTPAAIKVLHNRLMGSAELTTFLDEARMVAHLTHAHIVRVLDFGVDGETPFLVMDYAPGGTLRQRHQRGERLPVATIVPYVRQVADALHYAHEKKVVHRDVKPENMLVGPHQEIVLSDFGIALVAQSSRYQSTQEVIGTVAYMSPEQIQGKPRPASDQYALGISVYEWLCGERPFSGSFTELCTQHLFAPVPPLREKVPTLSPEVERVVTLALAKEPKERFGSVQAFATALEAASQTAATPLSQAASPEHPRFSSPQQAAPRVETAPPALPPTIPAAPSPLSSPIPVTSAARVPDPPPERSPLPGQKPSVKGSRQKKGWRMKAILIASVAILVVGSGLAGFLAWNNAAQTAAHVAALTAAYQSIVRHKPGVEYNMQALSSQQRQNWVPYNPGDPGCTFVAQGYLVSDTANPNRGTCGGPNGLSVLMPVNILVQVTINIQSGTCGALAISDPWQEVATLCADGTTMLCAGSGSGQCPEVTTNAIHQGLHKDNLLALERVATANNQIELIAFINGQYVLEQTANQIQFGSNLYLEAGGWISMWSTSPVLTSILYTDVKVWRVANPVS